MRMRIGRLKTGQDESIYTDTGQEVQVCIVGWGEKKQNKKTETVHADQKSAPDICAHCSLPPPKTSRKIHCST